LLKQPWTGF